MGEERENKDRKAVEIKEHQQKVLDNIEFSGLNSEERQEVQQLITREADVFSVVDSDIGNITSTQMEIKLQEKTPVQLNYHHVLKPPYAELKAHLKNLYNKGWIINSSSSYSSAVILVKKRIAHYVCVVTIVNSTAKPSQIDTLYLKYEMYLKI